MRAKVIGAMFGGAVALTIPLVEKIEGVEHNVYYDIAGIPTVCAGITGKDVVIGKTYTQRECDNLLVKHISVAVKEVDKRIKVKVPDDFRAAMYSFTYNAGTGAYRKSKMLRLTNEGDLRGACNQLWSWTYFTDPKTGKKKKSRGLHNRRAFEYEYCVRSL
ncbi:MULTISPECIES: lysozyme [Gammaproteobacteria]|uniref:lysozyme n=1 Tax=Gammaproteobacteria TaxID=1236 RepID=UPI002FCB4172